MHDIRAIRENPNAFDAGLLSRGVDPAARTLLELDERRRTGITDAQTSTERANALSREIGAAMKAGETDRADALKREAWDLKEAARHYQDDADEAETELDQRLARLPNLPLADVPYGKDAEANVLYREHHEVHRAHLESGRQHFEIGEALGLMDFEAASAMSGARFVMLKGHLARLERALGQFMLDLHTERHGYTEVNPPLLVRENALFGTGQLPKFADDQFRAGDEHWLIPTAEVPLTNLVRDKILSEAALPLRYTALTPCFRLEAGSAGRDTRGMLRQHQFNKVELVAITTPDASLAEHERMLDCAEQVMKRLDLRFRTMTLCTGDMGFGAAKTYDIEVWMPGQSQYREISSVSTFRDFQARRMSARYRAGAGKPAYVHTLNGSGTAVGRALIAVMENYQNPDGSITIPDALIPHMGLSADFQPIRRIGGKDAL